MIATEFLFRAETRFKPSCISTTKARIAKASGIQRPGSRRMVIQTTATESVIMSQKTTAFIAFTLLPSRRSVGIDAALDLSQAFVVAINHGCDCDRASDEDGNDRNQIRAQVYDGIEDSIQSPPPAGAKAHFFRPA
jgi:hypothetical protein